MSIIYNGVGLFLTDSEIILAKLSEVEEKYLVSIIGNKSLPEPLSRSTSEIILISFLEDFFDSIEDEITANDLRILVSQKFSDIFSFPLEKSLNDRVIREQIEWEFSVLFPQMDYEKFIPSYFVTETEEGKFANVFIINKKIPDAVLKFALRKKLKPEFFEHPAIAAFNAAKLNRENFDFFTYASSGFFTIIFSNDGKIRKISSFDYSDDNFVSRIEFFIEKSGVKSGRMILTGPEVEATEEKLKSFTSLEIIKPDFNHFVDDSSIDKINKGLFPPLIGLLSRVK